MILNLLIISCQQFKNKLIVGFGILHNQRTWRRRRGRQTGVVKLLPIQSSCSSSSISCNYQYYLVFHRFVMDILRPGSPHTTNSSDSWPSTAPPPPRHNLPLPRPQPRSLEAEVRGERWRDSPCQEKGPYPSISVCLRPRRPPSAAQSASQSARGTTRWSGVQIPHTL